MHAHRTPIAAAVLAAGAILAGSAHAASPSLYVDPLGDSKTAPDIGAIAVTDNGDGTMSGDIGLTGGFGGDEIVYAAFDTDGNPATGLNGADYVAVMSLQSSSLARWDGSKLTPFKAVPASFDAGTGIVHFTFAPSDMGSPTTFGFFAGTLNGDDSDRAPDVGEFARRPPRRLRRLRRSAPSRRRLRVREGRPRVLVRRGASVDRRLRLEAAARRPAEASAADGDGRLSRRDTRGRASGPSPLNDVRRAAGDSRSPPLARE